MVKNIYIDTKIILNCQKAKLHLHLAVALDPVVGVHLAFLKSVPISLHFEVALLGSCCWCSFDISEICSRWLIVVKGMCLDSKLSFHIAIELSYTLKRSRTFLFVLFLVLVYIWQSCLCSSQLSMIKTVWNNTIFFVSVRYKKPLMGTPKGPQYANRLEVLC